MMAAGTSMLSARGLSKEYGTAGALVRAVDSVSLDVAPGESVAIVGPSGCGKSTLLYLLGGLERPTSGTLQLAGKQLEQMAEAGLAKLRRHGLGFVFQGFHLVDELTSAENVELPMLLAGASPRNARQRAAELLGQVGLADRTGHLPSALSGGERQRVAIARAVANEPLVVLADEPTGNLDTQTGNLILTLLRRIADEQKTAIMMATHSAESAAFADSTVKLRDGRIAEVIGR
jgi:putative ABC transport system ATP-binding protein